MNRRDFLKALGVGAAAVVIEEPVRKLWFVGSNAPVGSRIERVDYNFPVMARSPWGHTYGGPPLFAVDDQGRYLRGDPMNLDPEFWKQFDAQVDVIVRDHPRILSSFGRSVIYAASEAEADPPK